MVYIAKKYYFFQLPHDVLIFLNIMVILVVLFWQPALAVLFWCPFRAIRSWQSYMAVLYHRSCPSCPFLAVLS
jgi:hypothetical protein